jgi:hypothetical protein
MGSPKLSLNLGSRVLHPTEKKSEKQHLFPPLPNRLLLKMLKLNPRVKRKPLQNDYEDVLQRSLNKRQQRKSLTQKNHNPPQNQKHRVRSKSQILIIFLLERVINLPTATQRTNLEIILQNLCFFLQPPCSIRIIHS